MKRFIYILVLAVAICIASSLPVNAYTELPDTAIGIYFEWVPRFIYFNDDNGYWYSRNRAPTVDEWDSSETLSPSDEYPYRRLTPAVIFKSAPSSSSYYLESATSYYFEYIVGASNTLFSYNTNSKLYSFISEDNISTVFGDFSSDLVTVSDPLNEDYSIPISDVARDWSTSVTANSSRSYIIRFAFTTLAGVDSLNLSAILMPSDGYFPEDADFTITSVAGWYDPNGDVYDIIVQEGLQNINNNLEDIKSSVEEFQSDVNDALRGDPNDYQDNSEFEDAASDLMDKEDEINDIIYNPITMPDGSTVYVDENIFSSFRDYIFGTYDPPDYEADVGTEITKVFETFMPYVGAVVFLNLMLAVVLAFLRGRANA